MKDDSGSDWLSRRRDVPDTELSLLAKSKLLIMMRNLGGKPVEQVTYPARREFLREDARRWFFERSDFQWWCEQANFEPDYVLEKALGVYENGLPERSKATADMKAYQRAYHANRRKC